MIFINPQTDKSLFEHSECEQGLFFYTMYGKFMFSKIAGLDSIG